MEAAHALIPGSRLEIVPDCGHSVYFEHPEVFNRVVTEFIAQSRGCSRSGRLILPMAEQPR